MSKKTFREKVKFKGFESLSIAKRITLLYGGIFTLSLIAINFFLMGNAGYYGQSVTRSEIQTSIDSIEEYILEKGLPAEEDLEGLLFNKYVEVMVIDLKTYEAVTANMGRVPGFMAARGGAPPEGAPSSESQRIQDGRNSETQAEDEKGNRFMIIERIVFAGKDEGYRILAYKMLPDSMFYVKWLGLRLIIIDIIGILFAFLIGRYISRLMLRPVEDIRSTAERISIEDLSRRIEVKTPDDEMRELTITFNSMIDRLETAFISQARFVSDASHEMRTPIATIQGYANLINRWGKNDPKILQESIDAITTETEHMSMLIKNLLFLANGDQNKNTVVKTKISLNDTVRSIVKDLEVMDTKRNIRFVEDYPVSIYADGDLIKQLIWIHTENSIKYTAEETGEITYRVYKEGEYGCLDIWDNGTGIADENLPLIFDRFYRADKSRNKEIPGAGLGLSIAKWIMSTHDGEVTVRNTEKGTVFTDKFRLLEEEENNDGSEEK